MYFHVVGHILTNIFHKIVACVVRDLLMSGPADSNNYCQFMYDKLAL